MTDTEFFEKLNNENLQIDSISQELVKLLIKKEIKIATAESCTGGLVSKKITDISGASKVFDCGICSYSNGIKAKVLSVSKNTLIEFGAVSEQSACEMAKGVRRLADADIGISTTGIAGPTGGTTQKPVGLVYVGVSTNEITFAIKCLFNDDNTKSREEVRSLSAAAALYYAYKAAKNM